MIGTISYERQLPGLFAVGQFTYTKGEQLLRLRNITAPVLGAPVGRRGGGCAGVAVRIDRTIPAAADDGRLARTRRRRS